MIPVSSTGSRTRDLLLGALFAFAALNAFGGGWYGMAGAEDVPVEWLNDTPFTSYFIPGLILFVIVGGAFLIAAVAFFRHHALAVTLGFVAVGIVLIWLTVQILMIGYVSWMQPATAIYAMILLVLLLSARRVSSSTV
jgi:hypothetical protein